MFCVKELENSNGHSVLHRLNPDSSDRINNNFSQKSLNKQRHTCLLVKFNGLGGGFPREDIFAESTGAPSGKLQMSNSIFPFRELRDNVPDLCLYSLKFMSTPGAVSISVGQFFLIGDVWLDEHDSGFT